MTRRAASAAWLAFLCAAAPVRAAAPRPAAADDGGAEIVPKREMPPGMPPPRRPAGGTPAPLRLILQPLRRGMFIRLPVMDTDPNRGVTYGVMPILVLQGQNDDRIQQIHAPSLTYNKNFKISPTYRYYYYPQEDASLVVRASRAKYEHEVMFQYEDRSFAGTPYDVVARIQKNRDAGQRFFGLGPDSPKKAEANYIQDYWQSQWGIGAPLGRCAAWRAHLTQRYMSSRTLNGPLHDLPAFVASFPTQYADNAQQTNETRLSVDYDTRDHPVTTARGAYAAVFAESSVRGYLSQYDYERYGADARWFRPWAADRSKVFAIQAAYTQLLGRTPPFWILPSLGGKYSLRAYGDGRYVDRGVAFVNVEQRIKVYEARTAGVTTELQLAPFAGLGTAFDAPQAAAAKYVRPVVGGAVRAVARPQVVGSVDFGVGREGVAAFMDINYSF